MARLVVRLLSRTGQVCRASVASVLAGLLLGWTGEEVEARLHQLPLREQAALVGAMLAGMAILTLMFAQAGAVGVLSFWLAALAIAR